MEKEIRNALDETYARDSKHLLADFLRRYYKSDLFDQGEDTCILNEEISMPLEKRPSGVLEALEELVPLEKDINDESEEMALEYAVGNVDLYMTEYLLKNGADPNYWNERMGDLEEKQKYGLPCNNWYLAEIDYLVVNDEGVDGHNDKVADMLFDLMELLIKAGDLDSFYGVSTGYDAEKREISIFDRKRKIIFHKSRYSGKLFEIVKKHIDAYDCYCLLEGGAPKDEFDSESYKISERISCLSTPEKIAKITAMIFQKSFGGEEKPGYFLEMAKAIAEDIKKEEKVILEESKKTAVEMGKLIFQQTKNENFTRSMLLVLSSEYEKKQMIRFIKENNPDLTKINHYAFDLEMGIDTV